MSESWRQQMIDGLRELATFLETHPDVPAPYTTMNAFALNKEEFQKAARSSSWDKEYQDSYVVLRKEFSGAVRLEVNLSRQQVCERVVVGQKVIPATPERVEDIVEWECEPILEEG